MCFLMSYFSVCVDTFVTFTLTLALRQIFFLRPESCRILVSPLSLGNKVFNDFQLILYSQVELGNISTKSISFQVQLVLAFEHRKSLEVFGGLYLENDNGMFVIDQIKQLSAFS